MAGCPGQLPPELSELVDVLRKTNAGRREVIAGQAAQKIPRHCRDTAGCGTGLRQPDPRTADVTLVGFSMGGGEVARYLSAYGPDRVRSVVFASSVTPYLAKTPGNPDGPLPLANATKMAASLTADQDAFYEQFTTDFFSVDGRLTVTEEQRLQALALAHQADKNAALQCMTAFANTDFRDDLAKVTVPTLVTHGDGDFVVFSEGSGARTHAAIPGSELVFLHGAPHGCNVSHAEQFNDALLTFLGR